MSQLVAAVESESHPQSGQDHRSSGDFSIQPGQYSVKISGPNPKQIFFIIKRNVGDGDPDPTVQVNVGDGSVINFSNDERAIYIADPRGAAANFVVEFYR